MPAPARTRVPIRAVTVLVALAIGVVAVLVCVSVMRGRALATALAGVTNEDPAIRAAAWDVLVAREDDLARFLRGGRIDDELRSALRAVGPRPPARTEIADAVLIDAADRLAPLAVPLDVAGSFAPSAWSWEARPPELMAAEVAARFALDAPDARADALDRLAEAPRLGASTTVMPLAQRLAERAPPPPAPDADPSDAPAIVPAPRFVADVLDALDLVARQLPPPDLAAATGAGRRGTDLVGLMREIARIDPRVGARAALLLAAAGHAIEDRPEAPAGERAARLLNLAATSAELPDVIRDLRRSNRLPRVAILRVSPAPAALERLERLGAGETVDAAAARYALAVRRERAGAADDVARLRRLALDERLGHDIRMLAAWRHAAAAEAHRRARAGDPPAEAIPEAAPLPPDVVRELAERDLASDAPRPWAAALLVERCLDEARAILIADDWRTSLDVDRRAAAALLDLLTGNTGPLADLGDAIAREDDGRLRTVLRIAHEARGGGDAPADARRAFALSAAATRPDLAAATAIAYGGRPVGLLLATRLPDDVAGADLPAEANWRAWVIERFADGPVAAAGRPTGGDEDGLRLHLAWLDALAVVHGGPGTAKATRLVRNAE